VIFDDRVKQQRWNFPLKGELTFLYEIIRLPLIITLIEALSILLVFSNFQILSFNTFRILDFLMFIKMHVHFINKYSL
jgi:hypothetical protein